MTDIDQLTERILAFRDERDWKQFHNPKDMSLALALEAAEVMEHFLWKNASEMDAHVQKRKEEVGDELADVLYWTLLMSHDLDIDVAAALASKIKKNAVKYPVEKAKGRHTKHMEL